MESIHVLYLYIFSIYLTHFEYKLVNLSFKGLYEGAMLAELTYKDCQLLVTWK